MPEDTHDKKDDPEKKRKKESPVLAAGQEKTITHASKEYAVIVKPDAKPSRGGKGVKRKARGG